MTIYRKNIYYKNYFSDLNKILKILNNNFLFKIPNLYKRDLRNDKISIIKINFNFLKNLFNKSIVHDNYFKSCISETFFISHYVGNVNKDKDLDFYYGKILKDINNKTNLTLILINHTNEKLEEIKKKFSFSRINRIYLDNNFSFILDFFILIKIFKEYFFFLFQKRFFDHRIQKSTIIKKQLTFKAFLNSRYTFKLTNKIINILNKSQKLKNLITTFEGHAFEKILFKYCSEKKINSIGYYFSIIREYKNNIYYKFVEQYQPKIVLTSGYCIKEFLKKNSPFKKKIEILGSNKSTPKILPLKLNLNKKKTRVLVCPEGLYSETFEIFNLINHEIFRKKNIIFIFRSHPLINLFKIFHNKKINKNIILSKNKNIQNDFNRSDFILYSGSSVCIEAVLNGLIPINFKPKRNFFSYDPLFEINKFIVGNSIDLYKKILNLPKNKNLKKKFRIIQLYCKNYFVPINSNILLKNLCLKNKI